MLIPKRVLAVLAGGALTIGATAPAHAYYYGYSSYSSGYNNGYRNGNSDGYRSGYSTGESRGYSRGYDRGEDVGYDKGYDKGYGTGKSDGITEGYASGKSDGYASGYSDGETDGFASGKAAGVKEGYSSGYDVGFADGRDYEQTLIAAEGSAPPLAGVPNLTSGMEAPSFDVGTDLVNKGTVSYSNSIGSADSFSVGASTNIGATATASSTPDYNVTSKATFGIGNSTINQVIGTSIGTGTTIPSNPIKGSFAKAYTPDSINNDVTVSGIGTDAAIVANSNSDFTSNIKKGKIKIGGELVNSGAGSANGSAGGSVGTTSTASANSSQFVSSFAQAY